MTIPTILRLFHFTTDGVVDDMDSPSFSKVIEAVNALNGVDIDTVSVTLSNGDSFDVGGGKDDEYKCHVRTKGSYYELVNPHLPRNVHDLVTIMMSQEESSFPRCCIVSREMVLKAIETFCTSGLLDPSLTWDDTLEYEPL